VALHGLGANQGTGAEDAFTVIFGPPDAALFTLVEAQAISAATPSPLLLTVINSAGAVGDLTAGGTTGDTITLDVTGGMERAEITFNSRSGGSTTVYASMPGFRSPAAASLAITVDTPNVVLLSRMVGAGLQIDDEAQLGNANHGGVTVRVESSDATVALVAPDVNTPGSDYIEVDVAPGADAAPYVVQGVAGATGSVTITASAPGFVNGVGTIEVVQPAVAISVLSNNASVGIDDEFVVGIGISNAAGTGLFAPQWMSAANVPPLILTVTSSDGSVGQLSAGGSTADTITLDWTADLVRPSVTFHPPAPGTTTIAASIPGFLSAGGSVDVTVSAVNITPFSRTIGAGLQYGNGARLDSGDHSGVTVRIESSDSTVALIAPDVNTPGSSFIDVDVAAGETFVPYVVQGVAGAVGRISVTASAAGFDTGVGTIDIVQPAVTIATDLSSQLPAGAIDVFTVYVGVSHSAGTHLSSIQGMSAANVPPLVLTVTSSDGTAG
jgi:hypothetical protein